MTPSPVDGEQGAGLSFRLAVSKSHSASCLAQKKIPFVCAFLTADLDGKNRQSGQENCTTTTIIIIGGLGRSGSCSQPGVVCPSARSARREKR